MAAALVEASLRFGLFKNILIGLPGFEMGGYPPINLSFLENFFWF
jgi:hypothetical protein